MSVRIRLRRMGKKKQPHYRIVVADSRSPRDGRFVENLGYYNPLKHPDGFKVDVDRVDYWLGEGAIPSPTVKSLVSHAREVAARAAHAGDGDAAGEDAPDTKAQEAATAQAPQADDGGAEDADAPDAKAEKADKAEAKSDAGGAGAPDAEVAPDGDAAAEARGAATVNAKSEAREERAPDAEVAPDDAAAETTAAEASNAAAETDRAADEAGAAAAKDGKASADEAPPNEVSAEDASKA